MRITIHRGGNNTSYSLIEISTDASKIMLECGWNQPPSDVFCDYGEVKIEGLTYGESTYGAVFITHHNRTKESSIFGFR